MADNLDLYAKIEPLIGFYEAYDTLYLRYLNLLAGKEIKSVLDIGCGNGEMLLHLQDAYDASGIDLSPAMVERARTKGVDAICLPISEVSQTYDAALAIADVLNYISPEALPQFLLDISKCINKGGYFLCDINTLFGFEEVTAGSMSVDTQDQFLSIEAEFEEEILQTKITYFEAQQKECFTKSSATITQYYHDIQTIESLTDMYLIAEHQILLFGDEPDKVILVFQKGGVL